MNNKTRYAVLMLIGVLMNQGFYALASVLHLPVWLDVCGTAFAAFALEPTAGLLVGLVNNFYLALFEYDSSTLIYYSISAAVALITGCCLKKDGVLQKRRIIPVVLLVALSSAVLTTLLAVWRAGGELDVGWERTAYEYIVGLGLPKLAATFLGSLFIKLLDTFASAGLVAAVYAVLPHKLKHAPEKDASAAQA